MAASNDSHKRAALSATVSSTGWMSVGELLMTRRISLVAVCCSSASVRSRLASASSRVRASTFCSRPSWDSLRLAVMRLNDTARASISSPV